MKVNEPDEIFLDKIKKELDSGLESMDSHTLLRLREGRFEALAEAAKRREKSWFMPGWVTAGGVAAIAVFVIAFSIWFTPARPGLPINRPEDLEIITTQEHLELYQDLEFYKWLADRGNEG
jgi:hypothetical protein